MNSTYRGTASVCLLLATCCWAMPPAGAAEDKPLSFRFTETLRVRDQQTELQQMNGSVTEHVSSEGGAIRIDATLPITDDLTLDPSTPVVVTAGSFTLRTTLSADPRYRAGMHQANILLTSPTGSGKSAVVTGHEKLSWNRKRLTLHIDGNLPALTPVCAGDFLKSAGNGPQKRSQQVAPTITSEGLVPGAALTVRTGADTGETSAQVEVGQIRATARLQFRVKSSARTVEGGPYEDSGIEWKFIKTSAAEMRGGQRTARETTVTVTGKESG